MRLPTDPAKLKVLTREYIIKHCKALEKKADAFKKQLEDFDIKDWTNKHIFSSYTSRGTLEIFIGWLLEESK